MSDTVGKIVAMSHTTIVTGTQITSIVGSQQLGSRIGCKRAPSASYWFERGNLAEIDDDIAHARYCYQRAVAQRPAFAPAHNQLARLAQRSASATNNSAADFAAQLGIAESHYRLAICSAPGDGRYWFNLGLVLEQKGTWSEAMHSYQTALQLDAGLHQAHMQLAAMYEQRHRSGDVGAAQLAIRHLGAARRAKLSST
jgi:tetratricopeptide (TPR) repeat protein